MHAPDETRTRDQSIYVSFTYVNLLTLSPLIHYHSGFGSQASASHQKADAARFCLIVRIC